MAPDAPTPDPSPECFYRYAGPSLGSCDGPVDWTDRFGNPFCRKHRPADPSPDTPSTQHIAISSNKEHIMDNTPNTISIDGTDYVRADSVTGKEEA